MSLRRTTSRVSNTIIRKKEHVVGKVIAQASMSLDGYISKDDNTIGRLFDWLQNGEVEFTTATEGMTVNLSPQSAKHWEQWVSTIGALVCGRTLFDFTDGWDGRHIMDVPVVVVTHRVPADWVEAHPDAPFHFVTDGIETAVAKAQELAGDRDVTVSAGTMARQCLELGLLDEVAVDLGAGGDGEGPPILRGDADRGRPAGDPTSCVQGDRVTHLRFPVTRPGDEP
jgi:dihydrofolate reductase